MQRISTTTRVIDKFGVGKDGWTDGDVIGGVPATDCEDVWFDNVQEEIANVVEGAGLALSGVVYTQLKQAIDIMVRKRSAMQVVAAGTADAITGDFVPDVSALVDGLTVFVLAGAANATTTPTFKADATAAKTIVKGANLALAAGDIAGAGYWVVLTYTASLDKWVMQNPATGIPAAAGYLYARDEKAAGTNGGNSAVGTQTRTLNTVVTNTLAGVAVNTGTGQITFTSPAANGTYRICARAPVCSVDGNKAVLHNVTAGAVALNGSSNNGLTGQNSDSLVKGQIVIAATTVFELRHFCATASAGDGLGSAANLGGLNEVYSEVEIFKVS